MICIPLQISPGSAIFAFLIDNSAFKIYKFGSKQK